MARKKDKPLNPTIERRKFWAAVVLMSVYMLSAVQPPSDVPFDLIFLDLCFVVSIGLSVSVYLKRRKARAKSNFPPTAKYSAATTRNKSIAMLRTYQCDAGLLVRAASKGLLS